MKPLLMWSLVLGGCCTDVFCRDHVIVSVSTSTQFQPGRWTFSFTTANDSWSFDCPLLASPAVPYSPQCGDTGPKPGMQYSPEVRVDARTWSLEVASAPRELTVKVARDGVELATETLQPSYVTYEPNGPLCTPKCKQANVTVALP